MTAASSVRGQHGGRRRRPPSAIVLPALLLLLAAAVIFSAAIGAAGIPPARLLALVGLTPADPATFARDHLVLWSIRLPRIALAAMIGGLLAVSGAMMQGLFRNPLADPAMVGVSSGAAFAAALTIVVVDRFATAGSPWSLGLLPVTALIGALITTAALSGWRRGMAGLQSRSSCSASAIAALTNAGIGFLVFMADDRQLRDITFWMLGSLWRRHLAEGGHRRALFGRDRSRHAADRARARPSGARRNRSFSHGDRRRAAETDRHSAGRHCCRRGGGILRRGRLCRHRRAASAASRDRSRPSAAVAGIDAAGRSDDARGRQRRANGGGARELPIGIVTAIVGAPFFLPPAAPAQSGKLMSALLTLADAGLKIGAATLLDRISLSISAGERIALIGPNGAGKSSACAFSREVLSSHGGASLLGRPLPDYAPHELAERRAVLSQQIAVAFPFRVAEIVAMGGRGAPVPDAAIDAALDRVGLAAFADRIVTTLSGGEQQRAHIARVLIQMTFGKRSDTRGLIFLDEPTASLDLRHQLDLAGSSPLRGLGPAVVSILHDLNLVPLFAERVIAPTTAVLSATARSKP